MFNLVVLIRTVSHNAKQTFVTTRSRTTLIGFAIFALMAASIWYFFRHAATHMAASLTAPVAVVESTVAVVTGLELPAIENKAFAVGERLSYNVIFKGVTVGRTVVEVKAGSAVNDRPTLQYISTSETNKFFDDFFKVRDENVTTVDQASLFSVAFYQNLHEGHYEAVRHYNFDYLQKKFTASEKKKHNTTKKKEGTLDAPLYDVLSALYSVRARELTPGHDITVSIFRDNTGKPLTIKVDGVLKELKTALGKVSCLRVEPMLQGDSLFKTQDNRLVVWMTNDKNKIPVLMEATISAGLIRIKLDKWEK